MGVELERARLLFPRWKHPYRDLSLTRAKRILGQAHSDGRIKLSRVFIGTHAMEDLQDTIRHELAHLIAGLRAQHGPRWKAVAAELGATPRAAGRALDAELVRRMEDAPYDLIAVMASGEEINLRPAFRRSTQYLDFEAGVGRRSYFYRGQAVLRFHYRERP